MAEGVSPQESSGSVTRVTTPSSAKKGKRRQSVISASAAEGIMPPADVDSARRHMIAYFYAAYSGCNCDACKALRPIAQKLIKSMEGGEG